MKLSFKAIKSYRYSTWVALFCLVAWLVSACSQESTRFIPRQWHNLNAYYNAYFIARDKVKEVDQDVLKTRVDNYSRVLEVYPSIKRQQEQGYSAKLLEAIKKASMPMQRHKNSDWVDDSYFLIGKIRYYKTEDIDQAIATFKYVNTKSTDRNLRHKALIWLMRTYIKADRLDDASTAADYLKKQKLIKPNLREYYVTKAWYHQKQREYVLMADNVELALSTMKYWPSDERARLNFIAGQLRQREGKDSVAYRLYRKCILDNPPYEMGFNAKLNMAQVTAINDPKAIKRVNRYFKKMLKDLKNEEFKDRIYYEMAQFERKQKHYDKAIEYYRTAVKEAKNNNVKGYAYLRIAEMNYDLFKKYPIAKLYYDSTVTAMDTIEETYPKILKRKKILDEFVKHWDVVVKEDSLQKLALMDTTALNAKIDKMIAEEEKKKAAADKERKKKEKEAANMFAGGGTGGGGENFDGKTNLGFKTPDGKEGADKTWYFSNPLAVAAGNNDFIKKFGRRPLEDNWRRSQKDKEEGGGPETAAAADSAKKAGAGGKDAQASGKGAGSTGIGGKEGSTEEGTEAKAEGGKEGKAGEPEKPLTQAEKRKPYLDNIPFTKEKLEASNAKLRPALYELAKVYQLKLEEEDNAVSYFNRIVNEHYAYEKTPEVLYFLYLIHRKNDNKVLRQPVQDQLLKDHPETIYAKLVLNPDYLRESRITNDAVKELYREAYQLYEEGKFVESAKAIEAITLNYSDNEYKDKLQLLRVLITGRTLDRKAYMDTINHFIKSYTKSPLLPYAKDLLNNADAFTKKNKDSLNRADSVAKTIKRKTPYRVEPNSTHMFVVLLPVEKGLDELKIQSEISYFNRNNYPEETFTTANLLLGDDKHFVITVREFKSKIQAMNYLRKQLEEKSGLKKYMQYKPKMFIMTLNNFPLFYRAKDIAEYEAFFRENYDMSVFDLKFE